MSRHLAVLVQVFRLSGAVMQNSSQPIRRTSNPRHSDDALCLESRKLCSSMLVDANKYGGRGGTSSF